MITKFSNCKNFVFQKGDPSKIKFKIKSLLYIGIGKASKKSMNVALRLYQTLEYSIW